MKTPTDSLLPTLATWELDDLKELQAALSGLIEALEPPPESADQPEPDTSARAGGQSRPTARGHIETKYIPRAHKRHGPYLYLRYWQGGKLRSKYLGKPKR